MDNSAMDDQSVQELSPCKLRQPDRRRVRRRLVQSTLFPLKPQSQDPEENGAVKGEKVWDGDDDGEDEDCCGSQDQSQSKGKRKPRTKTTTPIKASEKVKGKRSGNAPKKNLPNIQSEDAPLVIPDLRLEARMTVQENSRIFAGKEIHPFFSSWKASKKSREVIDVEVQRFAVGRDDGEKTCGPIHVFERTQEQEVALDWRAWTFCEEIFMKSSCFLESTCSTIFEGSVECLNFDKLPIIAHPNNTSNFQDKVSSDKCFIQLECGDQTLPIVSDVSDDEKVIRYQPLKNAEDSEVDKVDSFSGHTGWIRKPDIGQESRFLEERMKSYYFGCGNQPRNSLWTYKYQPRKAMEVCGNDESVNFLSGWLQHWCERDFQSSKDLIDCDTGDREDNDYICSESDSDSGSKHQGGSLNNVLLVTGPVGSGKSAAIYACAQEQGFEILEVNASECRNGALVKQRFGEALESRQLKRSLANPVGLLSKHIVKPSSALANGTATQEFDDGVVKVIPLSDEDYHNVTGGSGISDFEEAGSCCHQNEIKPLILFEDVDITFLEDRGFIAAVQRIAETAKGPIILTSNSHKPLLPDNLDRVQICFTQPSPEDLLGHVFMICSAERANLNIQPHLLEQVIGCCQGDIRKTIMHLQFWCQGRSSRKAGKVQRTYGSLLFDLEAGHQILPKLSLWELPSPLSELVEKEITESLSREEKSNLMSVIEEEELHKKEVEYCYKHDDIETETIEAKKAAMLSRNCSIHDYDEFPLGAACEVSDNSDAPFSCFRQNVRKKHDVVSSDSECELRDHECAIFSNKDTNNEALIGRSRLFKKLPGSAGAHMNEKHFQDSETAGCIPINDECKSVDVSCVPESSFVPETEINNDMELNVRTVSCDNVRDTMEEVSVSNQLTVEADNQDISKPEIQKESDTLENNHHVVAEFCPQEEVEDSQNEHMEALPVRYQVMDESSRMDSSRMSKYVEKLKPLVVTDVVQKSWNKLRSCHANLAQYVGSEEQHALQIVKLTYKMSNLISETDVLLSSCQSLTSDSLEPSLIPSEESVACSSYDKWLLASTTAQHGFYFYAKDIAAVGSTLGSVYAVDLASEMLASATGMMVFGKLAGQDMETTGVTCTGKNSEFSLPKIDISLKRENKSCLVDVIQPIVPSKACMSLKGAAFYEYLSSLRCISRSEASRLSEDNQKPRKRRRRAARHYLSSGALKLSPEEISSLGQINMYKENFSQQADAV